MHPRIPYTTLSAEGLRALSSLSAYVRKSGLETSLVNLVFLRASQMNGCAFCIDMHWTEAKAASEQDARLYGLDAWRETPLYTERERAALEWTEAVTRVGDTHVPDAVFESMRPHFSDKELVDLTLAVASINAWNRMAISFRAVPASAAKAAAKPAN